MTSLDTHLARLTRRFVVCLQILAGIALIAMMIHITANAVLRKFASSPIWATNEFVAFWYMPVLTLLGFMLAQIGREQIEARLVFDKLPKPIRREIEVFGLALVALLSLAFGWYTAGEALHNMEIGLTGGIVFLPIWFITFLVPIAFVVMAAAAITDLCRVIVRRSLPDEWGDPRADIAPDERRPILASSEEGTK